jgi:cytochrome c peroxidase
VKFDAKKIAIGTGIFVCFAYLSHSVYRSFERKLLNEKAEREAFQDPVTPEPNRGVAGHMPLEEPPIANMAKVVLGREIFNDRRLSGTNSVACASCHDLKRGGDDGLQFSKGINGQLGLTNSPTVFNSSLNFRQFWDGRAEDLAEQVQGPIHNPVEMGTDWPEIVAKLGKDESFKARYSAVYGSEIKPENLVDAIVEFEKTLITVDSPFDRYLRGEKSAMTETQIQGYKKFESFGCVACHQGRNIGGNMYQRLGVAENYFMHRGGSYASDLGRYNVTKKEEDKYLFRVPSLRNVELTAPYFHDGSVATLEEAVRKMARFQLGRTLTDQDISDLAAFLKSLTGKTPRTALPEREVADAQAQ